MSLVLDAINVNDIDYFAAVVPERTGMMDRTDVIATMLNQDVIDARSRASSLRDRPRRTSVRRSSSSCTTSTIRTIRPTSSSPTATSRSRWTRLPVDGTYYAANMKGQQQLNSTEIGWVTIPAAVFYNLPDGGLGDITVTVEHEDTSLWDCGVRHPEWPTIGGHTTFVIFDCDPA